MTVIAPVRLLHNAKRRRAKRRGERGFHSTPYADKYFPSDCPEFSRPFLRQLEGFRAYLRPPVSRLSLSTHLTSLLGLKVLFVPSHASRRIHHTRDLGTRVRGVCPLRVSLQYPPQSVAFTPLPTSRPSTVERLGNSHTYFAVAAMDRGAKGLEKGSSTKARSETSGRSRVPALFREGHS